LAIAVDNLADGESLTAVEKEAEEEEEEVGITLLNLCNAEENPNNTTFLSSKMTNRNVEKMTRKAETTNIQIWL